MGEEGSTSQAGEIERKYCWREGVSPARSGFISVYCRGVWYRVRVAGKYECISFVTSCYAPHIPSSEPDLTVPAGTYMIHTAWHAPRADDSTTSAPG